MCETLLVEGGRRRRQAPNGEVKQRNPLHLAINANDSVTAVRLIEEADVATLNRQSVKGGQTPLMLLAMGHCDEALIWRLLERRASVAVRSQTRQTAADYAQECGRRGALWPSDPFSAERIGNLSGEKPDRIRSAGSRKGNGTAFSRSAEVVETLRRLEAEELQRTEQCRCPVCGDVTRQAGKRSNLSFLFARADRGEEENPLIQRFCALACYQALLEPRHHHISGHRQLRKEISESMALVEALETAVGPAFGAQWHVVDLCCGWHGVTSSLLALRYPGIAVTSVDKLDPCHRPHLKGMEDHGVSYVQLDVLSGTFIARLREIVEKTGRPVAILGMHLCGRLSLRAIEAFDQLDSAKLVILSPCCLPPKDDSSSPPHLYASKDNDLQYDAWVSHLESALSQTVCATASVSRSCVEDILSPKNAVLWAVRFSDISVS